MADDIDSESGERPDWWRRNQRLRERMGLPSYEPPRFDDGRYKHEVVESIEREYDCEITFRSTEPRHPSDWELRVDGERVATTERRRTDRGNAVYQLSADEFVELVTEALEALG